MYAGAWKPEGFCYNSSTNEVLCNNLKKPVLCLAWIDLEGTGLQARAWQMQPASRRLRKQQRRRPCCTLTMATQQTAL